MAIGQRAGDIKLHLEIYRLMGEDWGIECYTQNMCSSPQGLHWCLVAVQTTSTGTPTNHCIP